MRTISWAAIELIVWVEWRLNGVSACTDDGAAAEGTITSRKCIERATHPSGTNERSRCPGARRCCLISPGTSRHADCSLVRRSIRRAAPCTGRFIASACGERQVLAQREIVEANTLTLVAKEGAAVELASPARVNCHDPTGESPWVLFEEAPPQGSAHEPNDTLLRRPQRSDAFASEVSDDGAVGHRQAPGAHLSLIHI